MEFLGEWVKSNLISIRLDTVLVSMQDRCLVCTKHTMAQKSFWKHPMVLLGGESQVEPRSQSVWR